jgi:hypothetical protein
VSSSQPVAVNPALEWGQLARFDLAHATRMPTDLVRSWQIAQQSQGLVVRPIERFELAGTLNGHPDHVRSDEAKKPFGAIFALAVASHHSVRCPGNSRGRSVSPQANKSRGPGGMLRGVGRNWRNVKPIRTASTPSVGT